METDIEAVLDVPFVFERQPGSVPVELRPRRRLALLVLAIDHCRGKQATVEQLHALNWAIKTAEEQQRFLEFLAGRQDPGDVVIRFDPSLDRVVHLAEGLGLVETAGTNPRVGLTQRGRRLAAALKKQQDCLVEEQEFLNKVGTVTQSQLSSLFAQGLRL